MPAEFQVSHTAEKARYDQHRNHISNPGYVEFLRPATQFILENFNPGHKGLDFGCGPGPVAAQILQQNGYEMALYDPFYQPDTAVLKVKYDFILCTEVIEHFRNPCEEFSLMNGLLNPKGKLVCMTHLVDEQTKFTNWYYKNDPTHVAIYHLKTLEFLSDHVGFSALEVDGRLVVFGM